jgi:hypothetical protein
MLVAKWVLNRVWRCGLHSRDSRWGPTLVLLNTVTNFWVAYYSYLGISWQAEGLLAFTGKIECDVRERTIEYYTYTCSCARILVSQTTQLFVLHTRNDLKIFVKAQSVDEINSSYCLTVAVPQYRYKSSTMNLAKSNAMLSQTSFSV